MKCRTKMMHLAVLSVMATSTCSLPVSPEPLLGPAFPMEGGTGRNARCGPETQPVVRTSQAALPFTELGSIDPANQVKSPVTGQVLAEYQEWVYAKAGKTQQWRKLIPGRCPQWSSDGKKFFYFLDVGYDGCRAELWSADANGENRLRCSRSDYFIRESPVVSEDGRKLAYHYQTCMAAGGLHDIVVIDLVYLDGRAEAKVVLRTKERISSESLRWLGTRKLRAIVGGKRVEIDALQQGKKQLP